MNSDLREKIIKATQVTIETSLWRLRALGLGVDNNIYSDQNIAELLTQHPTQMAFGTFTYIFANTNQTNGGRIPAAISAGRSMMGYEIGEWMLRKSDGIATAEIKKEE